MNGNPPKDHYKVLGIPRDASASTIKKAFRRCVRKCHPDLNANDPKANEKTIEVYAAKEILLGDPEKKRQYDELLRLYDLSQRRGRARQRTRRAQEARERKARQERERKAREARARRAREEQERKAREARAHEARKERARRTAHQQQRRAGANGYAGGAASARAWTLPGVQDLTKGQEAALARPVSGRHLILGGPGTGKTVLLLLRAMRLHSQGEPYVFLVYNHMLHEASKQQAGAGLRSKTYMAWYLATYKRIIGKPAPRLNRPNNRFQPIDWEAAAVGARAFASSRVRNKRAQTKRACLLIDEGQDMPPEFYSSLLDMGFRDMYVAADPNQRIQEPSSNRADLEKVLSIDSAEVLELMDNLRNNFGIARLALAFYTGDRSSPPPRSPRRGRETVTPALLTYAPETGGRAEIARRLVGICMEHRSMLMGILTPNNRVRESYLAELLKAAARNGKAPLKISTYAHRQNVDVRYDQGGIVVINAQSCKGLDFDVVVLADIDEHIVRRSDLDAVRRLFYVMVSRARGGVLMTIKRNARSAILDILPKDETVLKRKEL